MGITWGFWDAGAYFTIELYSDGGYYQTISSSWYASGNYGSYIWYVPDGIPKGTYYQIKITSVSNSSIYDFSNYFSINERTLTVLSPHAGDVWYTEDTVTITWTAENIDGTVELLLRQGESTYIIITNFIPVSEYSCSWEVPSSLSSGSYRVYIRSNYYLPIDDYSEYFSIKKRSLTLTSPDQGTFWFLGETHPITWVSDYAGEDVSLLLYEKRNYSDFYYELFTIAATTPNDGSYSWTIPASLNPAFSYKIYLRSVMYSYVSNFSHPFFVEERYIRVTSPASEADWYLGNTYRLSWESKNVGDKVTLELYQAGTPSATVAVNISNNGTFLWHIPKSLDSDDDCTIKIKSVDIPDFYGLSSSFSLLQKNIVVSSPSSTATLFKDETYEITWETCGFSSNVRIELCVGTVSSLMIAANASNTGSYDWQVPLDLASGSKYQIKITSLEEDSIYAYTAGSFIIENTFLQQWLNTIVLCVSLSVGFIFLYVFLIRKWLQKIAAENQEEGTIIQIPVPVLSEEEYEAIWEQQRA
ncbi:MAG: hypothetical protein JXA00_01075 [Candidatus Thermoplasmatota archaeon]|nr:hypothetical protein [Candidatus Thermoplasmatota archaeon]